MNIETCLDGVFMIPARRRDGKAREDRRRDWVLEQTVLHFELVVIAAVKRLRVVCVQKSTKAYNMERAYIEF